jgi:glyoxylase-like metal-dependent hydrolase (beta-lactamase superfamily II)/ferredoxin
MSATRLKMKTSISAFLLLISPLNAFVAQNNKLIRKTAPEGTFRSSSSPLFAAPKRLEDNVDGVLYVNDRCIDCSTCSHFAPSVFERKQGHHAVHTQPQSSQDVDDARAALAACPVAAIRVETAAHRHHRGQAELSEEEVELAKNLALSPKLNGRDLPFPRALTDNVWYLGHHNEHSFGATPYLTYTTTDSGDKIWIMVDTPRFGKSAINTVTSLTGDKGPDYLLLTHVDDTADHGKWKEEFPNLKRIFHAGDLGRHNWVGDLTLEHVEILLKDTSSEDMPDLQAFDLDGNSLSSKDAKSSHHDIVIYHTPGHSPGSISMLQKDGNILFTGDTLAYTQRTHTLTGMPQYGNDRRLQKTMLDKMELLEWHVLAPGHGHARDFTDKKDIRSHEMQEAKAELEAFAAARGM